MMFTDSLEFDLCKVQGFTDYLVVINGVTFKGFDSYDDAIDFVTRNVPCPEFEYASINYVNDICTLYFVDDEGEQL